MHTTGYLAWINDEQYWHREFRAAQARVVLAQFSGKDTLLRSLTVPCWVWCGSQPPTHSVT
jgi:hypothetical protein